MTKSLVGFFFICILTSCSSLSNSKHNERLAQLQNIEEQKQSVKKPGVSYDEFTRIWGTGESMSTEGESISMTYEEEAPPLKVVFIKENWQSGLMMKLKLHDKIKKKRIENYMEIAYRLKKSPFPDAGLKKIALKIEA